MSKTGRPKVVYLTVDEISALRVIAESVIEKGGKVEWQLPVSEEWIGNLRTASKKLDEARGDA